ncbi:glycogen debranching protein GlgX [Dermabacter sp. p3-SID358]|uniref:glycogen debranching protein GlgX n=1 Tax=Dermabacter sp. p3-SID358 TaxID=2916114 RepID=UPI0021A3D202|nr:glycogen debranching protein GlgX [Dermabacter sp. p3-SID358]MCT1866488.1 glycogen debranching protein GlgX [Dermabacter sp. p3-SID358]
MTVPPPPSTPGLAVNAAGVGTYSIPAPRAEKIELCFFEDGIERRIPLPHVDAGVHWGAVEGLREGTHYGLRAYGPWEPEQGLVFNPHKLLIDPFAHGIDHASSLLESMFAHTVDSALRPVEPLRMDPHDNASSAIHSVVTHADPHRFDPTLRPQIPLRNTVIYEAHVRGFSQLNPALPPELRGTYAGLAHEASIRYLRDLGITAIELLPIHASLDEVHLTRLGLTNYWGYNTLSFFAPNPRYATKASREQGPGAVLAEVQDMVNALHAAGIEVILDVVYNHTAEGAKDGPTVSFRGLDAREYYWQDSGHLADFTGTGNTFDARSPFVVDLIMRSLRFWTTTVGVDGFRFDLATTLARGEHGFDPKHPLVTSMQSDPALAGIKLIAEPWDVGSFGWQTGNFPAGMSEWNDSYRDDIRGFWLSSNRELNEHGSPQHPYIRDLATRFAGSADIFRRNDPHDLPTGRSLRSPLASINFVTAHDGFTLADLTTYNDKHNVDNGEEGRDGTDNNRSFNHGIEGPDTTLEAARDRSARNLVATLLTSAGVPMMTAGDERLRTQNGNNNAYCHDNALTWLSWESNPRIERHLAFTSEAIAIRKGLDALRPTTFFDEARLEHRDSGGITWLKGDASPMSHDDWFNPERRHLTIAIPHRDGLTIVVMSNERGPREVRLPANAWGAGSLRIALDSSLGGARLDPERERLHLDGPTVVVVQSKGWRSPE